MDNRTALAVPVAAGFSSFLWFTRDQKLIKKKKYKKKYIKVKKKKK